VVCLGEALVDLVSVRAGVGLDRAPGFRKAAGGAPANVAVGVARLGHRAAMLGAVGGDPLGRFLTTALRRHHVDVAGLTTLADRRTALALVSLTADGDRDFLFYGDRPAHLGLRLTRAMRALLRRARVFHYGSISLIAEPSRGATLAAIRAARVAGAFCSYDPNLRPGLWPDVRTARRWLREGLAGAHIVKLNAAELRFVTGEAGVARGLRTLVSEGVALAVVTLGSRGCAYISRDGVGRVPGFAVDTVDTTGAGDAFAAGLLVGLLEASAPGQVAVPAPPALRSILAFANATAALSTERRGGIPSLPSGRRVAAFLRRRAR
jgi:fructokinase